MPELIDDPQKSTKVRFSAVLIFCILTVSACSSRPYVVHPDPETSPLRKHTVFVVNHGWHTGFILPSAPFKTLFPFLHNRFGDVPYYEFGWGDHGFYQAEEITTGLTLQSILWPTRSVVYVVPVKTQTVIFFHGAELFAISLSENEMDALLSFIGQSFHRTQSGNIVKEQQGHYIDSQFYTGSGNYHLFNNCNTWTAKGLKSVGIDISQTFKLTADSVMSFLKGKVQGRTAFPRSEKR